MNVTRDACEQLDDIDPRKIVLDNNDKATRDGNIRDGCNDLMDGPEIRRAELPSLIMEEGNA